MKHFATNFKLSLPLLGFLVLWGLKSHLTLAGHGVQLSSHSASHCPGVTPEPPKGPQKGPQSSQEGQEQRKAPEEPEHEALCIPKTLCCCRDTHQLHVPTVLVPRSQLLCTLQSPETGLRPQEWPQPTPDRPHLGGWVPTMSLPHIWNHHCSFWSVTLPRSWLAIADQLPSSLPLPFSSLPSPSSQLCRAGVVSPHSDQCHP